MAAGRDAANENMRKEGRAVWNKRDFYIAMCVTAKLLEGNHDVFNR